ncbi:hypothetical protein RJ639_024461 [Escallonia herrerae]|uniref:Receptor-like serine/threonine-protein kinase n=1 Tax=Escallonia herrerae TaxID=1293975 RepID=A0AA89ADZ5_9ASTE|nr:hypothetical protein RJ639_024461 [Escallonia herrerae]
MDGLKKRVSVLELILLFFSHFSYTVDAQQTESVYSHYFHLQPAVNLSSSWTNSLQNSSDFADGSQLRPILVVYNNTSPPFVFGFFGNGTGIITSFYLVVCIFPTATIWEHLLWISYPPVVVWSANRDRPVMENATLDFTDGGALILKDKDGILVWGTNTSGSRLMLTTAGNLMLVDDKDTAVWQSFDHSTDTWLPSQNISVGQRLIARESSFNLATGQYYLSLKESEIVAYISSDPPKQYATFYLNRPIIDFYGVRFSAQPTYARFDLNISDFRYIRLESDGHLNVCQLYYIIRDDFEINSIVAGDLFEPYGLNDCDYPTKCGNSGVCSDGECSCPGGNSSFFTLVRDFHPNLGCKPITPLSCTHKNLHTFLELKNVTDFSFTFGLDQPLHPNSDVENCKKACLDNCTCKAALFQYKRNISSGQCSMPSQLYSLMAKQQGRGYENALAFIKIQKSSHRNKSSLVPKLVPSLSVGLVIIATVAAASCYYYRFLTSSYNINEDGDDQVTGALKRFCFQELKSATRDFQIKLGRGGFGSVYEGDLADGTKVAVKRLDSIGQGRKEFLAEVKTIGSIHHFNLVRLIGYCVEQSNRLLVYEHMCNGALDKWIFNSDQAHTLSWEIRRKIIIGLAKGLEYLHSQCDPNIIHFDIKPQNILLNGDFSVKISDFGLAKLIDRDQSQVLTVLKGTPGYMAPELYKGTNISVKADVYSFGIVVLEILFGRKNSDSSQYCPLIDTVKEKAETEELHDLVDGYNEDMQLNKEEAMKMIKIAIMCIQAHNRRPSMSTILKVLEDLVNLESVDEYCFVTMPQNEADLPANFAASNNSTPPVASILSGPR